MADHVKNTTQQQHPWRAVTRTLFAAVVALAALAPVIYTAATGGDPTTATGAVGGVLFVAGAITRIMALPGVERFLRRFAPFLAAGSDRDEAPPAAYLTSDPRERGKPGAIYDDGYDQSDRH